MPRRALDRPATAGSLDQKTLEDLRFLQTELAIRDRAVSALIGSDNPRNPVRDEAMRIICLRFGEGSIETISFYEDACKRIGSAASTRREIHGLAARGVVFLQPSPSHQRRLNVIPSERLVNAFVRGIAGIRVRIVAYLDSERGQKSPK